jgi:hypothetical protein
MEPVTAAWVVGLLAKYGGDLAGRAVSSAADAAEDLLGEKVKSLIAAVRGHFHDDPAATDTLDRLDQAPADPRRRGAVEERLDEALAHDPEFAATLERLATEIRKVSPQSVTVSDSGAVAVNGSVNLQAGMHAAGRDLIIGDGPGHRETS